MENGSGMGYVGRPRLKLTGHGSAEEVENIFASQMVDIAGVVDVVGEAVFIAPDDSSWPNGLADYEWLCSIIRDVLAVCGMNSVELSFIPTSTAEAARLGFAPESGP